MPENEDELLEPDDDEEFDLAGWDAGESSTGSMFVFLSDPAEHRPVKELYGAFRRPRNEQDRRAGELARRYGALDVGISDADEFSDGEFPEDWRAERGLGEVPEDEGRLVLRGLGGPEDMLYVAPTTNDYIAYAVLPNGGGGCTEPGPDGLVLTTADRRRAFVVQCLVSDEIIAVDIVVKGETRPARMGENAFGLRVDDAPGSALQALVLHRRDGTRNELNLRIPAGDDFDDDLRPGDQR